MNTQRGITLVEVLVATFLLVSITGILALSLVVVFDGYAWIQKRSVIDQDGQYIFARMKYISSQQDPHILASQPLNPPFSNQEADLINTQVEVHNDEEVTLLENANQGEYVSPIFQFDDATTIVSFVAFVQRPNNSSIEYQLSSIHKYNGSCEGAPYVFVGPDKTQNTRFSTDYFTVPLNTGEGLFKNPGECIRYKAYLSKGDASPTIYAVILKR